MFSDKTKGIYQPNRFVSHFLSLSVEGSFDAVGEDSHGILPLGVKQSFDAATGDSCKMLSLDVKGSFDGLASHEISPETARSQS